MTSAAAAIARPRWSAVFVPTRRENLASQNSTSCRKGSTAATAPVRWRRVMRAMTGMVLIFADLSNDTSYGEQLLETFGPRVIGVHIGRHGDGTTFERRRVGRGCLPVYPVGRSHLLEALHSDL